MHDDKHLAGKCACEALRRARFASAFATLLLTASAFFLLIVGVKWWHAAETFPAILAFLIAAAIFKRELYPTLCEVHARKNPPWFEVQMSAEGSVRIGPPTAQVKGQILISGNFDSQEERDAYAAAVNRARTRGMD